jgi:hypothetical protein
MMGWLLDYLSALGLTIVLEGLVVCCLTTSGERYHLVGASVVINLFTHPLASLCNNGSLDTLVILEATVMVTEAILYCHIMGLPWAKSALLSGAANASTITASFCL